MKCGRSRRVPPSAIGKERGIQLGRKKKRDIQTRRNIRLLGYTLVLGKGRKEKGKTKCSVEGCLPMWRSRKGENGKGSGGKKYPRSEKRENISLKDNLRGRILLLKEESE